MNISHLRFCIIGGRAFGKSQLVTSLIRIAGRTDGVVVPTDRSQRAIMRMQQILDKGDNIEGTSWDDVRDFQFLIKSVTPDTGAVEQQEQSRQESREWDISFTDYPGELFEKYIDSGAGKSDKQEDGLAFDAQSAEAAQRLMTRMESSDGLIILLPRNVHEYIDILRIYRNKLGDFLAKVLVKRPNLPVCLALNKWDMCDNPESEAEKLLAEDPAFSEIFLTVKGLCKNFFLTTVSAFGQHVENERGKWKRGSSPKNVLEMLFELSSRAEANRIAELTADWEGASGFSKTFVWPWKASSVCRKGFTLAVDRGKAASIHHRALGRLFGAVASIAVAGFATWTVYEAFQEGRRFFAANEELAEYEGNQFPNLDKTKLSGMKDSLAFSSWVDRVFFREKQESLIIRRDKLEESFNEYVYTNILTMLENDDYKDKSPWELSTKQREKRVDDRLKKINDEKGRLTDDATQSQSFNDLVEKENRLLNQLNENRSFYDDIFEKLKRPEEVSETDWNHQIPHVVRGIQDQHKEKQESHAEDWRKLDDLITKAEFISSNELTIALSNVDKNYPGADWRNEITRTTGKTNAIAIAREWFAEKSTVFAFFDAQRAAWSETNTYWRLYGPFDEKVAELGQQSDNGKIKAIEEFLATYSKEAYPLRSRTLEEIESEKVLLVSRIMEYFRTNIVNNKDDSKEPYEVRVSKAKQRQEAAAIAMKELPERGDEYKAAASELAAAEKFINDNSHNVEFEKLAEQQLENGTIRSIWSVLRDQHWKSEAAYADYYPRLTNQVAKLEKQRMDELDKSLDDSGFEDDPDASMKERIRRRKQRIDQYEKTLAVFAENTAAYRDVNSRKEKEEAWIATHEHYQLFDTDRDAIPQGDQRIRGITEFLVRHDEKEFPEYGERLLALHHELDELESKRNTDLNKDLANPALLDNEEDPMQTRIDRKYRIIAKYDEALAVFAKGSSLHEETMKRRCETEQWIDEHKSYVQFDKDLEAVTKGEKRARELEAFLEKHQRENYPEYRVRIGKLNEEFEELKAKAHGELTANLARIREGSKDKSWKTQVVSAETCIDLLDKSKGLLPESSGKWLTQLIRKEEELIEAQTKQGTFLEAYKTVMDNPDTNQWLIAIHEFCQEFRREDYPEQTNEFVILDNRKTDAEDAFNREYDEMIDQLQLGKPLPREFSKLASYHRALEVKAEEILAHCPTNTPLFFQYYRIVEKERSETGKYAKWAEVQHSAKFIDEESHKDNADARNVLMRVKGFMQDYSRTNDVYRHMDLDEEYGKVDKVRFSLEEALAMELNERMADSDPAEQIRLLTDFLLVICPGTMYDNYKIELDKHINQMTQEERRKEYFREAKRVLEQTAGDQIDPRFIVDTIEDFFRVKGDDNLGSPEVEKVISNLKNRLRVAQKEKLWRQVSASAQLLINQGVPQTDNVNELSDFIGKCNKEKASLEHVDDSRKQDIISQLDILISKVKSQIGDGSFKRIEDAEKAYKQDPSYANYQHFKDLLYSFDPDQPGNAGKNTQVEEKRELLAEDRSLLENVKTAFYAFLNNKSPNAFIEFSVSVNRLAVFNKGGASNEASPRYGAKHHEIDKCQSYILKVEQLHTLQMAWIYFDLRNSNYRNVRTQNWNDFTITVSQTSNHAVGTVFYEKDNVWLEDGKEYGDPRECSGNLKKGSDSVPLSIAISESMTIEVKDHKCMKDIAGVDSVNLYKILAEGHSTGKCSQTISIWGSKNWSSPKYGPPTRNATFTFEFSGIPTLSLE